MNTETYVNITKESLNKLKIINPPKISESEKIIIKEFVDIVRDFTEINQLFKMFLFNFKELESVFVLKGNDRLIKIRYKKTDFDDLIIINSLTNNFISSGVSFVNMLEAYLKNNVNAKMYDYFKINFLSKKYDECFSYRFVDFLRNYSQHAHLIVSLDTKGYCFDLNTLVNTPHFNYKKSIFLEMNNFIKHLIYSIGDYPRIAYSLTIAEYKLCLSEIFLNFLNTIEEDLKNKNMKIDEILKNKPEIINKSIYDEFDNSIIYEIKEGNVDILKLGGDLLKMFYNVKSNLQREKIKDTKRLSEINKMFNNIKPIPKFDGKFIIMNNM